MPVNQLRGPRLQPCSWCAGHPTQRVGPLTALLSLLYEAQNGQAAQGCTAGEWGSWDQAAGSAPAGCTGRAPCRGCTGWVAGFWAERTARPPPESWRTGTQGNGDFGIEPSATSRSRRQDHPCPLAGPPRVANCSGFGSLGRARRGQLLSAPWWSRAGRVPLPTTVGSRGPPCPQPSTSLGSRKDSWRWTREHEAPTSPVCRDETSLPPSVGQGEPCGLSTCEGRSGCGDRGGRRPLLKTEVGTALPEGRDDKVTGSSGQCMAGWSGEEQRDCKLWAAGHPQVRMLEPRPQWAASDSA